MTTWLVSDKPFHIYINWVSKWIENAWFGMLQTNDREIWTIWHISDSGKVWLMVLLYITMTFFQLVYAHCFLEFLFPFSSFTTSSFFAERWLYLFLIFFMTPVWECKMFSVGADICMSVIFCSAFMSSFRSSLQSTCGSFISSCKNWNHTQCSTPFLLLPSYIWSITALCESLRFLLLADDHMAQFVSWFGFSRGTSNE